MPVSTLRKIGETIVNAFDGVFGKFSIQTSEQIIINNPVDPKVLLLDMPDNSNDYTVGVVTSDLRGDESRDGWVFELARNGKPGVVVSLHRLDPLYYGETPDIELLSRRAAVEAARTVIIFILLTIH